MNPELAVLYAERSRLRTLIDEINVKIKEAKVKRNDTYRKRLCDYKLKTMAKREPVNREENEAILKKYGL